MNGVAAIVRANLLRLFSDRANLFFLVALPMMIVFALSAAIGSGGGNYRVGVVDARPTAATKAVAERVDAAENVTLVRVGSASDLRDDVARRSLDGGWVIETTDGTTSYRWFSAGNGEGLELRTLLDSAVEEAGVRAKVGAVVASQTGAAAAATEQAVTQAEAVVQPVTVTVQAAKQSGRDPASIRAVLAAGQLTLFIFLTSLTGASALLITRQLGVTRRMRAGPMPVSTIILGEGLSRFLVAMIQAGIVFLGSMLLGVDWRAPGAVLLLCVAMSLVGSGAAMLLGTLGRSEQQVGALGLMLGLVLAALGGSMQPLEFFPDTLRTIAFATPHAWMNDALWRILVEGQGVADIWAALAVLTGVGLALLGAASATMARTLR